MKQFLSKVLPFIILLSGVAMILYPTVSEHINAMHRSRAIQAYNDLTESMNDDERESVIAKAKEYNKKIASTEDAFYFPERVPGYDSTLDITGTGIMGYLYISKIGVELPVYHSVDENVLQIAAGHLPGTSLPVGGESTHCVISGHRGLPSARLFTDLDKLDVGDTFTVTVLSEVLTYQVDKISVVSPHEVSDLFIQDGKDYCTLFTCTPYGINSHRLLVRGKRIETEEEYQAYIASDVFIVSPTIVAAVIAVPVLVIMFLAVLLSGNKKNKQRK